MPRAKKARVVAKKQKYSRLQRFSLWFFDHLKTTTLLWLVLASFGAFCYKALLTREGFPSVASTVSVVSGTYFANDKSKVDEQVAKPIIAELNKRSDVKELVTTVGDNFFSTQIVFEDSVNSDEANGQISDLLQKLGLPKGAQILVKPIRFDKFSNDGDDLLFVVYSTSPNTTDEVISKKAGEIAGELTDDKLFDVKERVTPLPFYREGENPATGEVEIEQKSFDSVGVKTDKISFYPAATIGVKAKAGIDAIDLYDHTEKALERLSSKLDGEGYKTKITGDFAEGIREQIGSLQENLLGGLVAVLIISFLLINLRASFVTALSMVSVLAITVILLYAIGYTLNTITLFSLILCLGLIVDDTTIMVEAIDASKKRIKDKRRAVAEAVRRVALASTAGTLTTMLGFAPMLFVSGILGKFIRAIPVTIIISLAVSLVISLTLIPMLSRLFILNSKQRLIDRLQKYNPIAWIEEVTSSMISSAVLTLKKRRKRGVSIAFIAVLVSLSMVGASFYYAGKLKFNIFPATKDSDSLMVTFRFPQIVSIEESKAAVAAGSEVVGRVVAGDFRRSSLYASGGNDSATLYVDLISYKDRQRKSPQIVEELKTAFTNFEPAKVSVGQIDIGPPVGTFGIRLYGEDTSRLESLASDIKSYLDGLEVKTANGSVSRLSNAKVTGLQTIQRDKERRYLSVEAEFESGADTSALVILAQDKVEQEFDETKLAGYGLDKNVLSFDFGAESDNQDSFKTMLMAFPVLMIVIYLVLAIQFRSAMQPLLILSALPFSLFGVMWGLYLTNNPISFFVMVGVFALIGISLNNTILLTDYANQARLAGNSRIDSVAMAVKQRFRPLITTSLTSVVALIPLAFTDPFWESLGVTLIFGLLSTTFLVVVAFPYYYLATELFRKHIAFKQFILWVVPFALAIFLSAKMGGGFVVLASVISYIVATLYFWNSKNGRMRYNKLNSVNKKGI